MKPSTSESPTTLPQSCFMLDFSMSYIDSWLVIWLTRDFLPGDHSIRKTFESTQQSLARRNGPKDNVIAMLSRTTASFDGVRIVYSVSGTAETALVFIHGGMSDRSFWSGQDAFFAERFRVIALDLAGHGESGQNRQVWGIPEFSRDVAAVMDAEHVSRAVLIGNSLGGPTAIEAALLTGTRVIAVIGVDTFHDMGRAMDSKQMLETAEAWQRDFKGSMDQMLALLLHPDTEPSLYEDIRQRMSRMPIEAVCAMFRSFGGYDTAESARKLPVPVRCINGDRFPTEVQKIRRTLADFDAVVMPHTGHYPMLECPAEFNSQLEKTLQDLAI